MPPPIVYIDTSVIREGKLEELEVAMNDLATLVKANVPQLLSYGFFLNKDRTQMTVVAVHPDSASIEFHMDVCGAEFRKVCRTHRAVENRGLRVRQRFRVQAAPPKARMPGNRTVAVHDLYAGFARYQFYRCERTNL